MSDKSTGVKNEGRRIGPWVFLYVLISWRCISCSRKDIYREKPVDRPQFHNSIISGQKFLWYCSIFLSQLVCWRSCRTKVKTGVLFVCFREANALRVYKTSLVNKRMNRVFQLFVCSDESTIFAINLKKGLIIGYRQSAIVNKHSNPPITLKHFKSCVFRRRREGVGLGGLPDLLPKLPFWAIQQLCIYNKFIIVILISPMIGCN